MNMPEQKTAEAQAAENKDEQANAPEAKTEQKDSPTDGSSATGQDTASVGKENADTKSPHDEELERLRKLAAHKDEVINHKERALQAEKKKNKQPAEQNLSSDESLVEDETEDRQGGLKDEIRSLKSQYEQLARSLNVKTVQDEVNKLTNDPKEREAILLAKDVYNLNSGSLVQDLYAARAIVNAKAIFEQGKLKAKEEIEEENTARYSVARTSGGKTGGQPTVDPGVADILRLMKRSDAIKFVK